MFSVIYPAVIAVWPKKKERGIYSYNGNKLSNTNMLSAKIS